MMNKTRFISMSILPYIEHDPEVFKSKFFRLEEPESTRYYEFFKLLHGYLLKPDEYTIDFVGKPEGKTAKFVEVLVETGSEQEAYLKSGLKQKIETIRGYVEEPPYNKYKEWLERTKGSNLRAVTNDDFDLLTKCTNAITNDLIAHHLLLEEGYNEQVKTYNEQKIEFKYKDVECKGIIDRLIINHTTKHIILIDLKSTKNINKEDLEEKFYEYNYDAQMCFYIKGIYENKELFSINSTYTIDCFIVWICKTGSNQVRTMHLKSNKPFTTGNNKIDCWMDLFKWHYENNDWRRPREFLVNENMI